MTTATSNAKHNGHANAVHEPLPPFPEQHLTDTGLESELVPRPRYAAAAYRPAGKLNGNVAIITGADSGIGRAVALAYAREGADVAILYYSHDSDAEEIRKAVEDVGRRALTIRGDVSDDDFCRRAVQQVMDQLGHLDILVSNAAVQARPPDVQALSRQQLERTFQVNVLPESIRVNAVAPGPVWMPLNPADPGLPAEQVSELGGKTGMGRPAQPEEIAPACVFFASNADSSFITRQVLAELGGVTR